MQLASAAVAHHFNRSRFSVIRIHSFIVPVLMATIAGSWSHSSLHCAYRHKGFIPALLCAEQAILNGASIKS